MATLIPPVCRNTGSALITGLKRGPSTKLAGIQWGLGVWNACCGRIRKETSGGLLLIASEILKGVHKDKNIQYMFYSEGHIYFNS